MADTGWKDDWIERFVAQGRAQGRAEGLAEGRAQGRAEREIEDLVTAVLRLFSLRQMRPGKRHIDRVAACTDRDTLRHWFERAATVPLAEDVFTD
jgi:hypothetical protein